MYLGLLYGPVALIGLSLCPCQTSEVVSKFFSITCGVSLQVKVTIYIAPYLSTTKTIYRCRPQSHCTGNSWLLRSRLAEHGQVSFLFNTFASEAGHFWFPAHSQAAIQASKERAVEVSLKHFEWAKVPSLAPPNIRPHWVIMTAGSNSYGSRTQESLYKSKGKVGDSVSWGVFVRSQTCFHWRWLSDSGGACTCCSVYGWSNALTQSYMCTSWSCLGLRTSCNICPVHTLHWSAAW